MPFLSSGFFESMHIFPVGKKGQPLKTAVKYPYEITLKNIDERRYLLIAGIWQPWTDRETGEAVDTAALVTTEANSVNAIIHNSKRRMPTILTEELAYEWIQPGLSENRITEIATFQFPASER